MTTTQARKPILDALVWAVMTVAIMVLIGTVLTSGLWHDPLAFGATVVLAIIMPMVAATAIGEMRRHRRMKAWLSAG